MKAPLVRASLVKRRYTKYLALPFTFLQSLGGTKVYPDPVGVAGSGAKINVAYDTVLLRGIYRLFRIGCSSDVHDSRLALPLWE